jgi:hypothetical protein
MASGIVDIIQRILISGDREVTGAFDRIATAGGNAFASLSQAAQRVVAPFTKFQANLDNVEQRANSFGRSVADTGSSIGTFATRVAVVGAAVGAVGVKFLSSTLNISTALKSVSASLIEQRAASSDNVREQKKAVLTDFSHANALEDLRLEYIHGKVSIEQYTEQRKELNRTQQRASEQQRILQLQAEAFREEQAKDQEAAAKRAISIRLEAQYGGALASVLINLANVLDSVRQRFLGTFGPQIATFLTNIVNAVRDAAPAIFDQFQRVANAIEAAIKGSGSTIDDVIKNTVKFGGDLANAFITIIIPAAQGFFKVLQTIAEFINSIFGTNFSAGALIAAGIVLKITGLFGLLGNVVGVLIKGVGLLFAAFGPVGIIVGIIIALILTQLIPLLAKIDWAAIGKMASDAWKVVQDAVTSAGDTITKVWTGVVDFFKGAVNNIIGFFNDLIAKVKEFLGLTGGSAAGTLTRENIGDVPLGLAGGGLFRGRGGIDQNLVRLSDNEFVINPRATRHWGVGFLNAINAMVNPRGFADGGLVGGLTASVPRVAFAGAAAGGGRGGRPLTLVIGDQEFDGLTVQDDTADNMARFAQRRGVRSGGRKPLWFGGTK